MFIHYGHLLANELLDIFQVGKFLALAEGDGFTGKAGAARAANAVHVALRNVRQLIINHMAQLVNVNAAGGNIGGYEGADFTFLELLQGALAGVLAFIAVDGHSADAGFLQVFYHFVSTMLRAGEHKGIFDGFIFQHVHEQVALVVLIHEINLCSIVSAVEEGGVTSTFCGFVRMLAASCWIS